MPPKSPTTTSKNSTPSPKTPSGTVDAQAVKVFFTQLKALASAAGYDAVVSIHTENTNLHGQVLAKDQEIARLKNEMAAQEERKKKELREMADANEKKINEQEKMKGIALNVMYEHNERERSSHDETKKRVESLESTIKENETHISRLNRNADETKEQIENLKLDNANGRGKLAKAQKDYDALQQKLKERENTIDAMKATRADLEQRLSASQKRVKELEDESSALERTLESTKTHLAKIEGFAAGHIETNEDTLFADFLGLWEYAKTELHSQLKVDLPSDALRNLAAWDKLRQTELAQESQIPLPCSNTSAAKQMRLAFILAVLAREIDKYIFQPTYIAPLDEDNKLRRILTNQAAKNSEKESFCRSILLSMDPDTQARTCFENIQIVVRNVSAYLDALLSEDHRYAFQKSLSNVVQRASEVWKPIQCSRRRYEPDFEPLLADDEWVAFAFPGSEKRDKTSKVGVEVVSSKKSANCRSISIFPRLSVIENDVSTAYTAIIQLRSSHDQWMAADREMVQEPPSPTIGRSFLRRTIANPKSLTLSNGSVKKAAA